MKKILFTCLLTVMFIALKAQTLSNVRLPGMVKPEGRKEIPVPDILGYKTLKCDFHMHTIFSDGIVWPAYRVDEAWAEGLDAIAITDHIENQPSKPFVSGDKNSSYDIAAENALQKDIILIRAGEITRSMPPGHLNAIFLTDVNLIDTKNVEKALLHAKSQGAFIMWNHPGWKAQQPDTCEWMPMHQALYEKGLIHGVEVFNEMEYYPVAIDWCIDKNLTFISNSDIHGITSEVYDLENGYRPMTLVFAKDRSQDAIKQALFERMTLAWFDGKLAGKEELLRAIFNASLKISPTGRTDSRENPMYEVKNISAIPFVIKPVEGDPVTIYPLSTVITKLDRNIFSRVKVLNLLTGSKSSLETTLTF